MREVTETPPKVTQQSEDLSGTFSQSPVLRSQPLQLRSEAEARTENRLQPRFSQGTEASPADGLGTLLPP